MEARCLGNSLVSPPPPPGGGGHSHMEVTGMCGHDPQSRGLSVTNLIKKKGGLSVRTKEK